MGQRRKGWYVKPRPKVGDFLGMVLIGPNRYRSQSFSKRAAAAAWAEDEAGKIRYGGLTPAGRCMTAAAATDYLKHLEAAGRSDSHRGNVQRTLAELAAETGATAVCSHLRTVDAFRGRW